MKRWLLWIGLTLSYLWVVTPLGWLMRLLGWQPFAVRSRASSGYWLPTKIDSDDKHLYEAKQGWRGGRVPLPVKGLILLSLLPWTGLARGPEESELSSDLYVMF